MIAVVIGATGAVGRDLVSVLLKDPDYTKIITFTRRELGIQNEKLEGHIVDFDHIETWASEIRGDVLFSALGTSLKQAGSKKRQWAIDYTMQYECAKTAAENGIPSYVLVSSVGADSHSHAFYLKLKGTLEDDIKKLPFRTITILNPPSLIRKNPKRPLETFSVKVLNVMNSVGILTKMKPMKTEIVAEAMAGAGKETYKGVRRIYGQAIRKVADSYEESMTRHAK